MAVKNPNNWMDESNFSDNQTLPTILSQKTSVYNHSWFGLTSTNKSQLRTFQFPTDHSNQTLLNDRLPS